MSKKSLNNGYFKKVFYHVLRFVSRLFLEDACGTRFSKG